MFTKGDHRRYSPMKPKLLVFTCDWSINPNRFTPESGDVDIQQVRVKCTGRVDPVHIFESLNGDYDGVLLLSCPEDDCHFREGNLQAAKKVKMIKRLMDVSGLESERLSIDWASPLDPESPTKVLNEFIEDVTSMGSKSLDDPERLLAAQEALANFRLRAFVGNEIQVTERGNV
jgi:coenzyme F420-reducing hydrogenase delta subunit